MKLNGTGVTIAPGHKAADEVILLQYTGSFPRGTTGELKKWKAGTTATLDPGLGGAPFAVHIVSTGSARAGSRPNDPAHVVYVEVRRADAPAAEGSATVEQIEASGVANPT